VIYALAATAVVAVCALAVAAGTLCRLAHVEYILALTIEQQDADREEFVAARGRPPRRVRVDSPN